jgi:hypothetical protein
MFIAWSGRGILVPVLVFLSMAVCFSIHWGPLDDPKWGGAICLWVSSVLVMALRLIWKTPRDGSFFYIPTRAWPVILFGFGLFVLFIRHVN